jgi:hypothetical protein
MDHSSNVDVADAGKVETGDLGGRKSFYLQEEYLSFKRSL